VADVDISLGLEAKQLYTELQTIQSKIGAFAQNVKSQTDDSGGGLFSGLSQSAQQAGDSIGTTFGNIGGVIKRGLAILGISLGTKEIIEHGAHIQDLAEKYQISAETIQRFGNVASHHGSSLDSIAAAFGRIQVSRDKALAGGGENPFAKIFHKTGLTAEELGVASVDQLALALGKAQLNAAEFTKVAGKGALEVKPTIDGLAAGTLKFGDALSGLKTQQLKHAEDAFTDLKEKVTILGGTLIGFLIPKFEQGINSMVALAKAAYAEVEGFVKGINLAVHGHFKEGLAANRAGTEKRDSIIAEAAKKNSEIEAASKVVEAPKPAPAKDDDDDDDDDTDDQGRSLGGGGGGGGGKRLSIKRLRAKLGEEEAKSQGDEFAQQRAKINETFREDQAAVENKYGGTKRYAEALGIITRTRDVELEAVNQKERAHNRAIALEERLTEIKKAGVDVDIKSAEAKLSIAQMAAEAAAPADKEAANAKVEAARQELEHAQRETAEKRLHQQFELEIANLRGTPGDRKLATLRLETAELEKQLSLATPDEKGNIAAKLANKQRQLGEALADDATKSPQQRAADQQARIEQQRRESLADALQRDEADRRARGSYVSQSDKPGSGLHTSGIHSSGGLVGGSLGPALSDADFHKQFQRGGIKDGLSPIDEFHKQFQRRGLTRADEAKRAVQDTSKKSEVVDPMKDAAKTLKEAATEIKKAVTNQ
jgi:hypothetical protein